MTFAVKTNILLLVIILMSLTKSKTQEYSTTTEITIEPSTPSPPETSNIYATCDFDLENIENLLQFLPDICTEIYYNRSDLYDLYREESENFGKFHKKLNEYELRDQPLGDKEELLKYPFDKDLRSTIYNKVDWSQCVTIANSSVTDYLKCLKEKRLELIQWVPSVNESSY